MEMQLSFQHTALSMTRLADVTSKANALDSKKQLAYLVMKAKRSLQKKMWQELLKMCNEQSGQHTKADMMRSRDELLATAKQDLVAD